MGYAAIFDGYTEGSDAQAIGDDHIAWRVRDHLTFGSDARPSGLQRYRPRTIAVEAYMDLADVERAVAKLVEIGMCRLSADGQWMWVHRKAECQFGRGGQGSEQIRLTTLWRDVAECGSDELRIAFLVQYRVQFKLDETARKAGSARGNDVVLRQLVDQADDAMVRTDAIAMVRTDAIAMVRNGAQWCASVTDTVTDTVTEHHDAREARSVVVPVLDEGQSGQEAIRPPSPTPKPPKREHWAPQAAEPVIRHYLDKLGAVYPIGDVDGPVIRAVEWMRGPGARHEPAWSDPVKITNDLCRMVDVASQDGHFRNVHGRDLFVDCECVFGAKEGGIGKRPGVERKILEWWTKLGASDAKRPRSLAPVQMALLEPQVEEPKTPVELRAKADELEAKSGNSALQPYFRNKLRAVAADLRAKADAIEAGHAVAS